MKKVLKNNKMNKISVLTVMLIGLLIGSLFGYYLGVVAYNRDNKLCEIFGDKLMSEDLGSAFDGIMDVWMVCISGRGDSLVRKQVSLLAIMIFTPLTILSWKLDRLKK